MRILHLLGVVRLPQRPDEEPASGLVRAALELARTQVDAGNSVTVATAGSHPWISRWHGVKLLNLRAWEFAKLSVNGRCYDFRQHSAFVWETVHHSYDIIHAHDYGYLKFLRSRQKIMHFHSDPLYRDEAMSETNYWKPPDFNIVKKSASKVIAPSRYVKGRLKSAFGPNAPVFVVPNGIDDRRYHPAAVVDEMDRARRDWGVSLDAVVFLYCGAINRLKGVLILAEAFAEVARKDARAYLLLAGSRALWGGEGSGDDYEKRVRARLAEAEAEDRVKFLGLVGYRNMPSLYQMADIVVVPSLMESFGMVALEAQASGKPVIASNAGALPELVNPEKGLLFHAGDAQGLAQAMDYLLNNPEERARLGRNGYQDSRHWTWAISGSKLREVYRASGGIMHDP